MTTVNLSDELVNQAKRYAGVENRSVPKQIEYWAKIGKVAKDNPDLPYQFIEDVLIALEEVEAGEISEFYFFQKEKEKMIRIQKIPNFERAYKKLKPNQRNDVNRAIEIIVNDPDVGVNKKGDLGGVRIYKFSMVRQQALLAYTYVEEELVIMLLAVGPHENFYRDLKKNN